MKKSTKAAEPALNQKTEEKAVKCPFCGSVDTELYSLFGSLLSTSQYYCKSCRTAFEWIKWEAKEA